MVSLKIIIKLLNSREDCFILKFSLYPFVSGWPTACVVIDVPSSLVDVNVNPSKTAVHLSCIDIVAQLIQSMFEPLLDDCPPENSSTHGCQNTPENAECQEGVTKIVEPSGINEAHPQHHNNSATRAIPFSEANWKNNLENVQTLQNNDQATINNHNINSVIKETTSKATNSSSSELNILCASMNNTEPNATPISITCGNTIEKENQHNVDDNISDLCDLNSEQECLNVGSRNWSCGNAVTAQDGQTIAPVRIIRPLSTCNNARHKRPFDVPELKQSTLDNVTVTSTAKRPRSVFDVLKDTNTDKNWDKLSEKEQNEAINTACKEYDNFSKETTKAKRKKERQSFISLCKRSSNVEDECDEPEAVTLSVDFTKLSQKIQKIDLAIQSKDDVKIVGYLSNYNGAVIRCAAKYYLANLIRLQETLVFQKLSQSFKLPCVERDTLIEINENNIGADALDLLQRLPISQSSNLHPEAEILDERILTNGFKVHRILNASQTSFYIFALANTIPCYGINDLKEILLKIRQKMNLTVAESRPLKCVYYLQSEASRVALSSPALRCKSELLDAICFLKKNSTGTWIDTFSRSTCFHSKHIFSDLDCIN